LARIFGLLLIVLGIYLGLTVYEQGVDGALGGLFARGRASEAPAASPVADDAAPAESRRAGSPSPGAITQRVRQRVTEAVQQGARRHSGE
jgi:hypothetical protein